MTKTKGSTQDAHVAVGRGCRAKVTSLGVICSGLAVDTLDLVPRQARAACRDTLAGCNLGVDLCRFGGYPILALAYFTTYLVDPFGKPGWHAAVCAAARPRPPIGMERAATCGDAEQPSPSPTRLHISAGYPSGFLSCPQSTRITPNLSFPRLLNSAVSPAPTWAGLGRARSIRPDTH